MSDKTPHPIHVFRIDGPSSECDPGAAWHDSDKCLHLSLRRHNTVRSMKRHVAGRWGVPAGRLRFFGVSRRVGYKIRFRATEILGGIDGARCLSTLHELRRQKHRITGWIKFEHYIGAVILPARSDNDVVRIVRVVDTVAERIAAGRADAVRIDDGSGSEDAEGAADDDDAAAAAAPGRQADERGGISGGSSSSSAGVSAAFFSVRSAQVDEGDPTVGLKTALANKVARDGFQLLNMPDEFRADPSVVLAAVTQNGFALQCAPPHLGNDRRIVLAAVRQDGRALKYASAARKADREVIMAAATNNGHALEFASAFLRSDQNIVLVAVRQNGRALRYASAYHRNTREIVTAAVMQCGLALDYASADRKADREVVIAAVKQDGAALGFASGELQGDRDVVIEAVKEGGRALEDVHEDLRGDSGVVLAAAWRDEVAAVMHADMSALAKTIVACSVAHSHILSLVARNPPFSNLYTLIREKPELCSVPVVGCRKRSHSALLNEA